MKTFRHYYVGEDLDDIERIEQELEEHGISAAQVHVLSNDAVGVANHNHLHEVQSLLRQDVIRSAQAGAIIGFLAALLTILVAYGAHLPERTVGWVPYAFLSVIIFGFCIWEGGLMGIQEPNRHYRQFQTMLRDGKHILIVDVLDKQEHALAAVMQRHANIIQHARTRGGSSWLFEGYNRLVQFIDRNLLSQSQIH